MKVPSCCGLEYVISCGWYGPVIRIIALRGVNEIDIEIGIALKALEHSDHLLTVLKTALSEPQVVEIVAAILDNAMLWNAYYDWYRLKDLILHSDSIAAFSLILASDTCVEYARVTGLCE